MTSEKANYLRGRINDALQRAHSGLPNQAIVAIVDVLNDVLLELEKSQEEIRKSILSERDYPHGD